MKSRILFFIIFLIIPIVISAQENESGEADPCKQEMNKSIEKEFKKARELQVKGEKSEAYKIYSEILDEYPESLEVNYYYALGYYLPIQLNGYIIVNKKEAELALAAFNRIYAVCPFYKIKSNLYGALVAYLLENFEDAIKFAKVLIDNPDMVKDLKDIDQAELIIKNAQFYDKILNHPVPFNPIAVEGISTQYDEYLATQSPDGSQFYFTRRMPVDNPTNYFSNDKEDREFFSISEKGKSGSFGAGNPLPSPFNQSTNEGSPTINLANDFIIFARVLDGTINNQPYPNYDLFYSEFNGEEWSDPQSLGSNVNRSDSWESQPSLSSDGKMLFFASDRPGGYGGSDIWYTERASDGTWRRAVNLGPVINTDTNERSPFLHTDSKTLYFSSSGHKGMGGMDIFYSKLDSKKIWQTPVNIGYPINSENDEVDFFVSLDGQTAYFSSNNIENKDWNIYQFELYEEARPKNMIIVKGEVKSDDDDITETVVEIRDTASNVVATSKVNEITGKYAIATEFDKDKPQDIIVNVKKKGHSFDTKLIKPAEIVENVVTSDAEVKKVEVGKTYDLHDIYFETNLYSLTEQSKHIINLFVEFLNENPTVKVEIQGHTDNVGDDNDNQLLSERRARSVYEYALSRHVDASRIRYKGYGESSPIASNNTPEGRAKNRRTIFLIYEN
jgi:outer membrane protein OmpA-like peptidoglycan-associated protein/tetratricopeptide (TPR) repeat protein